MAQSMYGHRYQAEGPPPYHPCTVKQWASRVLSFSSQYNNTSWSAVQVLGEPKVYPQHGDIHGAWATAMCDANQFIEVEFEIPVRPTDIHIYETFNPGAVVRIKARETSTGQWVLVWKANHPTNMSQSRIFSPPLSAGAKMMKIGQLRIEVDCTAARTWCELDAVQLVGVRDGAVAPVDDTQFVADMQHLVNNKLHSDVKFNIDGKEVYGHKAILATRSPYFAHMFNAEASSNYANLKLPQLSFNDLVAAMHFIYTNRLPAELSSARLATLCKTSATFELPEMKTATLYKLVEKMTCQNVVDIYKQTQDDTSLDGVKKACCSFMASHLKEMSSEKAFATLPQSVIVDVVQEATMALCLNDSDS